MVLEVVNIGAVVIQIKQYCVGGSIGVNLNVGYVLVSVKPDTSENSNAGTRATPA